MLLILVLSQHQHFADIVLHVWWSYCSSPIVFSYKHWVQSKRHRLWFSTNWIWPRLETYTLKCVWCSTKTTFNEYASQRSHIQFEDKDYAVYMCFRWVTTTLSSLRTTTCDALTVPSDKDHQSLTKYMYTCTYVFIQIYR